MNTCKKFLSDINIKLVKGSLSYGNKAIVCRSEVSKFLTHLHQLGEKNKYEPSLILNMDESWLDIDITGTSTKIFSS